MAYDTNNYRDDRDPRYNPDWYQGPNWGGFGNQGGNGFNNNYGNYGWGNPGWGGYGGYGPTPYYNYYEITDIEELDDDDIKEDIIDNLASDWMISRRDFENINIEVKDGVATLSGDVRDRRTKHHAYSVAFWTPGVADVINKLKLKNENRTQKRSGGGGGQNQGYNQNQNYNQNYNPGYSR